MDYLEIVNKIEKDNEEAKILKATLEERWKNLKEEKENILKELKGLDISIEDINDKIEELDKEIKEELAKCQNLIT